jgi:hypothetical protein
VATSARTTYHDAGTSAPTSTRTNDPTNGSLIDRDDNGHNPDLAPDLRGHTTGKARSVGDEVILVRQRACCSPERRTLWSARSSGLGVDDVAICGGLSQRSIDADQPSRRA